MWILDLQIITLRNEVQIQNDVKPNSEWYPYALWTRISVFLHPLGLTPGKYLQSGTGLLPKHRLEVTDWIAWICPCSLSELVGIISQGFLVLSPKCGVIPRVYVFVPGCWFFSWAGTSVPVLVCLASVIQLARLWLVGLVANETSNAVYYMFICFS